MAVHGWTPCVEAQHLPMKSHSPIPRLVPTFCLGLLSLMLTACEEAAPTTGGAGLQVHVVSCPDQLPEFTTGSRQRIPKEKDAALCSCVWGELEDWERQTAISILHKDTSKVPERYLESFASGFDGAIRACLGRLQEPKVKQAGALP